MWRVIQKKESNEVGEGAAAFGTKAVTYNWFMEELVFVGRDKRKTVGGPKDHGHHSPTSTKTQSPNRDPDDYSNNSKQAKSVFGKASNGGHQSLTLEGETMDDCQGWDKAACHDQTKSQTNHPKRRRLPPFWTSNPKTWFFQVCGVNSNNEKFDNMVAALKERTAIEVQEFIVNPTKDSGKYDALKTALECMSAGMRVATLGW